MKIELQNIADILALAIQYQDKDELKKNLFLNKLKQIIIYEFLNWYIKYKDEIDFEEVDKYIKNIKIH